MNPNPLPPIDKLRFNFKYDPETGQLFTRIYHYHRGLKRRAPTQKWREVTAISVLGYLVASLSNQQIKVHRICWALHYNEDPYPLHIDHINRDKTDNRICNLRKVTPAENNSNRHPKSLYSPWSRKPVRITYPDGRGTIITDSLLTAGRLLRRSPTSVKRSLERDGVIYWGKGPWAKDSGIRIAWHRPKYYGL